MDKKFSLDLQLDSEQATIKLAYKIGHNLKGGEVIELIGDLGSGKTTFVRGLAEGASSHDLVSSPSFTIRNDYQTPERAIAHFDFYRLSDPGIVKEMLAEAIIDPETTVVIEWPAIVEDVLPADHISISLAVKGEHSRLVKIDCPENFSYLFNGVSGK